MVILVVNFRRSVIIAELWWLEVARRYQLLGNFCVFVGKTTPYETDSSISKPGFHFPVPGRSTVVNPQMDMSQSNPSRPTVPDAGPNITH